MILMGGVLLVGVCLLRRGDTLADLTLQRTSIPVAPQRVVISVVFTSTR
jgi:hypothetical protein